MKQKKAQWPWHVLTVLVLVGLAGALYYATSLMSYEWRWNRVPQYFAYQAEESQRATDISTVTELVRKGGSAQVTLRNDAGDEQHLTVDENSLQFAQGDDVAEGDVVGVTRHWAAGPLLWGLWTTLWLSVVSGVLGLLIGLVTGLCRLSSNPTLRDLSSIYVELVRGTPLLVQIFIFYFFIGTVMNLSREFAGIAALSLFTGAYVAEIIRSGVQSIARGQNEAARSLGLSAGQSMRHVVLPQALQTRAAAAGRAVHQSGQGHLAGVGDRDHRAAEKRSRSHHHLVLAVRNPVLRRRPVPVDQPAAVENRQPA